MLTLYNRHNITNFGYITDIVCRYKVKLNMWNIFACHKTLTFQNNKFHVFLCNKILTQIICCFQNLHIYETLPCCSSFSKFITSYKQDLETHKKELVNINLLTVNIYSTFFYLFIINLVTFEISIIIILLQLNVSSVYLYI